MHARVGTLGSPRHNVPLQPTPLIGRERELAAVQQQVLLDEVRLLTLVGPAGVGKTRLAVEAAAELRDSFTDGVWFVDLSPLSAPTLVLSAIAEALGLRDAGDRPLLEHLKQHLWDQHVLLLLDNFEHLLPAAAEVTHLLTSCSGLKVLTTSREPLRLRWERIFPVAPLPLPDRQQPPSLEQLREIASVALFADRAHASKPDFVLNQANAEAVMEVCIRLDGLPLAIELAAAWSAVLAPPELLARLERRMPLLRWGAHDLPPRHQTLRAAIGWSFDLLDPEEQTAFPRLAVFIGSWSLEAAEAVCAMEDRGLDLLAAVNTLVGKSLVLLARQDEDGPRFKLLDTVREYALEQLAVSGDPEQAAGRHASYFLALAERAEPELIGSEQRNWIDRLERDHDNLRGAFRWAIERGETEVALRLGSALAPFWWVRGHLSEGRRWLEAALAQSSDASSLQARALDRCGWLAHGQGDYERARELHEQCLASGRALRDTRRIARSLINLGIVARLQGEDQQAERQLGEGLTICRETGDTWGAALALRHLGSVARSQRRPGRAAQLYEESLTLFRETGDKRNIANVLTVLAEAAKEQGDTQQAATLLGESLALCREVGDSGWTTAHSVVAAVGMAAGRGQPEHVARLLGGVDALRELTGTTVSPEERAAHAGAIRVLRASLDERALEAARAQGRALSTDRVVQQALAAIAPFQTAASAPGRQAARRRSPSLLSQRERQVLQLVADGWSNKQIAQELVITERTATFHVTSILNKLGVDTRAHAVAVAARRGLLEAEQ